MVMNIALFPTTYITAGSAYHWISTYVSQDPDVMKQLRDRVVTAEDEEVNDNRYRRRVSTLLKRKDKAWSKDGVIAVIRPLLSKWRKSSVWLSLTVFRDQELMVRFENQKIWLTKKASGPAGAKWCIV